MMQHRPDYDVAIVGASVAGSAAAALLGRAGARVALIERSPDPNAFKRVCGHYIQPSGLSTLDRLGITDELLAAGAHRGPLVRIWTDRGWIGFRRAAAESALSIRRAKLDPILRRMAAETAGVDLLSGHTLTGLVRDSGSVRGVVLRRRSDGPIELRASLVVGADGRGSRTAELAGLRTRTTPNARFAYFGYFEEPESEPGLGVKLWMLGRDVAISTPTDSGQVLQVAMPASERLGEFRTDPEAALRAFMRAVPEEAPPMEGQLAEPVIGKIDLTNERRPATGQGVALIGDAVLAADPAPAVGCGWALQSAEWLADCVAPPLVQGAPLQPALRRYARLHRRRLAGHARALDVGAEAKPPNAAERLILSTATHDPGVARLLGDYMGRHIPPSRFVPAALARAARVRLTRRTRTVLKPQEASA
jgi:2-polyprenyl-6-methoxyphenol hydroxylase-like FAD-dependent oxidoreductase